jgi:intracellular septation protein A
VRVKPAKPNPLLEIAITIVAPSVVLTYGSDPLGSGPALVVALAFPLAWGAWDGIRRRQLNWLALIGIVSTLLTGGIGLLQLDTSWLAVKEGSVSALIGLVIAASAWTRRPLIHALVFDAALLDTERIARILAERGAVAEFEARLRTGTLLLAATFLFSAVANYALARWLVRSAAGTPAFNEELGRLTLLSYPLIALPSMLMMAALLWWLARIAQRLTGLTPAELMAPHH